MASITINNLGSAANIRNVSNNVLPIYQGNDTDGDTFKITPDNLVKQTLNIPNSGGSAGKYLNQQGQWTTPPDNNTTYALASVNNNGLMSTAQVNTLNGLTNKDHVATPSDMGWMSANDKVKIDALTTAVVTTASKGYMPTLSGRANEFLNGKGNWVSAEGTTYGIATTATDGLMSKDNVSRLNSAYAHAVTNKGISAASGLYKIKTNSEGHVTQAVAVQKADITALGIPAQDTNTTYAVVTDSANGLMKAADNVKLRNLTTAVATTAANGYMPKEDKGKVDKIDNVWRWRYHDSITGTGIKFYRYGDIVFFTYLVEDTWGNATTNSTSPYYRDYDIPVGFRPYPVMNGQTAFYGGLYQTSGEGVGVKSILRGATRDSGTKFRVEIGNKFTSGDTIRGQGELFGMWIADNAATNAPNQMTGIEA